MVYNNFIVIFSLSYIEGSKLKKRLFFWFDVFNLFWIENIDKDEKAAIERHEYASKDKIIWKLKSLLSKIFKSYCGNLSRKDRLNITITIKKYGVKKNLNFIKLKSIKHTSKYKSKVLVIKKLKNIIIMFISGRLEK